MLLRGAAGDTVSIIVSAGMRGSANGSGGRCTSGVALFVIETLGEGEGVASGVSGAIFIGRIGCFNVQVWLSDEAKRSVVRSMRSLCT